ncbi:MAG: PASTA domain-containing protein [Bacteroidales bacterium]
MRRYPLIATLLGAFVLSLLILYAVLKYLDIYTLHNKAVEVPDVKGLQTEEAALLLKKSGLRFSVIDSVFTKGARPGAIVEMLPSVGSAVKEGRIIFLTVNAITSRTAIIPAVRDLSVRQAYALLKAKGFESVTVEYVPGAYKDLITDLALWERSLEAGERVALDAPLVLKASDGTPALEEPSDTIVEALNNGVETWF